MRPVYFSLEALGALIILILLYANIFEIKQKSKKIHIFSVMLILNLVVVCADAVIRMILKTILKKQTLSI